MTWNYYQYNILRIKNDFDYEVMEECGENIEYARKAIANIRRECPNDKFVIQSLHCVARIVR